MSHVTPPPPNPCNHKSHCYMLAGSIQYFLLHDTSIRGCDDSTKYCVASPPLPLYRVRLQSKVTIFGKIPLYIALSIKNGLQDIVCGSVNLKPSSAPNLPGSNSSFGFFLGQASHQGSEMHELRGAFKALYICSFTHVLNVLGL